MRSLSPGASKRRKPVAKDRLSLRLEMFKKRLRLAVESSVPPPRQKRAFGADDTVSLQGLNISSSQESSEETFLSHFCNVVKSEGAME